VTRGGRETARLGGGVALRGNRSGVNTSGTGEVQLGGSDRINDLASLNMAGGTFDTSGFSETVGALSLSTSVTSTFDLGTGASIFHLATSSDRAWNGTLRITNWSGSTIGGGADQVFLGSNASGLTSAQLAAVQFIDPAGSIGTYGAQMLSRCELVAAIPEPGTALSLLSGAAFLLSRSRFRRRVI
jgi:hypothetical protein